MSIPSTSESIIDIKYAAPKTTADKFVGQVTNITSEGIRKIVLDPNAMQNVLSDPNSSEAGLLIQQLMSSHNVMNVPKDMPDEASLLMKQMLDSQKVIANPNAGLDLIRKRPNFIEKAIKEAKYVDKFEIDIDNNCVLDLKLNKSNKKDVIERLNTISKISYRDNMQEAIFYYSDIGLSFYFDENDLINEIEVDEKYKKATTLGLKINDSMDKAFELYGNPKMKSSRGAIWSNFSILMRERQNEIKVIRLKIRG